MALAVLGQATFDAKLWRESGVRIFFVNGDDQTPLHTLRDGLDVVRELRQLIRIVQPDQVHAWCGDAIGLTLLACQPWPWLQRFEPFVLTATELTLRSQRNFIHTWVESRVSSQIETLIVPHDSVAQSLLDTGLRPRKLQLVNNAFVRGDGIESDSIEFADRGSQQRRELRLQVRAEVGIPQDANVAVAIADLEPRHRLKDLIWATDLLLCVRDDMYFLLLGKGTQRRRLERFASQTEVGDHVRFLGLPESPERILAAADVYWHSHLRQPMAVTLLSAMSMGIPTVTAFGPETEAVIKHQETGLATEFAARDEYARWTKYLLEQPDSAQLLACQGQRHVELNFQMESVVNSYVEILGG